MRRLVLAGLLLAAWPALAGSYDDFNQGLTAITEGRGDDLAIAAFSRAIAAGDLAPTLQPTAYLDRGIAYRHTGRCDLALADFDMALQLRPGFQQTILNRASAELCLNRFDDALADFTALAAANPSGWSYFRVGTVYWMKGDFTSASDDFQKALKLDPKRSYNLLWLGISQLHNKDFDARAFADSFSTLSVDDWPLPILHVFLGRITVAQMLAEAGKADAGDIAGRKCEADFYGGEWQSTHGDIPAGKALFQDAVNICPKSYVELIPSQLELKLLQ